MTPTRPALRYHGGKWVIAPWIIDQFPEHRIYVEPFGGAASVLLRKPRSYAEVYNDLDDEIVSLFRVMRDPQQATELLERLRLTPYSRTEFLLAYEPTTCPIERARRLVVRSFMGFSSNAPTRDGKATGFRANANRNGTHPAMDWARLPSAHQALIERLAGVVIENRDAIEIIQQHDGADTLFYVDPPYVHGTRSDKRKSYRHEYSDADHQRLCQSLKAARGMVILSGYPNPIYERELADWRAVDKQSYASGAKPTTERLWINPAAERHDLLSTPPERTLP